MLNDFKLSFRRSDSTATSPSVPHEATVQVLWTCSRLWLVNMLEYSLL